MTGKIPISKLIDCRPPTDRNSYILAHMKETNYKDAYSLVDDTILIGLEVEVERVQYLSNVEVDRSVPVTMWNNVEDGSLRNSGREFVSIPLKGKAIPYAIQRLSKVLTTDSTCIGHEFSERTSVHVHMNIQDMSVDELMSLVYTYLIVEPLLYSFVGHDRNQSIFCIPITQSSLTRELKKAIKYLGKGDVNGSLQTLAGWMKYTGFNLAPITKFGTVEFRHMHGTIDEKTLVNWINIILSIKKFALRNNHEELLNRIFLMNTNSEYAHFIQEIFGDLSSLFSLDLQDVIEPCVIFLKDLHYTNDTTSLVEDVTGYVKNPFGSTLMQQVLAIGWAEKIDIDKMVKDIQIRIDEEKEILTFLEKERESLKVELTNKTHTSDMLVAYKRAYANCVNKIEGVHTAILRLEFKIASLHQGGSVEKKLTSNWHNDIFNSPQATRTTSSRPTLGIVDDVDF